MLKCVRCIRAERLLRLRWTSSSRGPHNNSLMYTTSSADSSSAKKISLANSYKILQITADESTAVVKAAFVKLAKLYHPDSSEQPDEEKFRRVEEAYRSIMEDRKVKNSQEMVEQVVEEEVGFRYKAPAHRQYLSNEGVGYGTIFQRQRQYQNFRLSRATETAWNYKTMQSAQFTEDALVALDREATKRNKTQNAIERVVEDLIQASFQKGEFQNLRGAGKPLNYADHNPYIDTMTQQMNKVLINNGFVPEWAVLAKETETLRNQLRDALFLKRADYGHAPTQEDEEEWEKSVLEEYEVLVRDINTKIQKFNLLAPTIHQQMVPIQLKSLSHGIFHGTVWKERYNERNKALSPAPSTQDKKKREQSKTSFMGGLWSWISGLAT